MKLLFITPYYKPAWFYGGPPKCISELAEALVSEGFEVTVITSNKNGNAQLYPTTKPIIKEIDGVTVHFLPIKSGFLSEKYFYAPVLKSTLENFKEVDFIHVNILFTHFSRVGVAFSIKNNIPLAVTPHGMLDKYSLTRNALLKKLHYLFFENRYLRKAKFVQFTTEAEYKNSKVPNGINKEIIPLGIHFNTYEVIKPNELDEKILKLVFLGRINRKKGLDLLIKGILLSFNNITLDVFGEDDENCLPELKKLITKYKLDKKITFKGKVSPSERDLILQEYDAFVLTSHQENFGLAVAEALYVGLPVLISNKVNLSDFVIKNNCGWVCGLTPNSISEKIDLIFELSCEERIEKGKAGKVAIVKEFDFDAVLGKYVALYGMS